VFYFPGLIWKPIKCIFALSETLKIKFRFQKRWLMRIKFSVSLIVLVVVISLHGFAQIGSDGSYYWSSIGITYPINGKYELCFGNKDHYSNQENRFDYYHFEMIGYRKITNVFSLGLGARQTESYKSGQWNPGQTYMFYGVFQFNPLGIKIKFANRLVAKVNKTADTQYGLDNISNVDFFTKSKCRFPKPYLMDEIFSNFNSQRVQTIRIYTGFHVVKKTHWGIDLFYCYQQTRSTAEWKYYNVLGISTKVKI
jgi:hypothetical protein